jgi:hypothetical protein
MSFRRYLAGLTLVALGGCVADDRSLTINNFLSPMVMGSACTAAPGGPGLLSGTWDVLLAQQFQLGYDLWLEVQNNISLMSGATVDTASYYLNSFDVELEPIGSALDSAIPSAQRDFNTPTATVRLSPGSIAGDALQGIPPALATPISAITAEPIGTIVVHVRPVSTRAEEQVVGAFAGFPVNVCNGCLTNVGPGGGFPTCRDLAMVNAVVALGNTCNISQDASVTCCTETGALLCGPDAATDVSAIEATLM